MNYNEEHDVTAAEYYAEVWACESIELRQTCKGCGVTVVTRVVDIDEDTPTTTTCGCCWRKSNEAAQAAYRVQAEQERQERLARGYDDDEVPF